MNIMWRKVSKEGRPHHPRQKKLDDRCQSHIKSEVTITSVVQCIEELVLNSLDSQPKCISIRLDASKYNIQVVDNGTGINKNSMLKIGERHSTSKVRTLSTSQEGEQVKYGHRGEVIASIIQLSSSVEIESRSQDDQHVTYRKTFHGGLGKLSVVDENRPCCGTTITINGLFHKQPIRCKRLNAAQVITDVTHMVQAFCVALSGKVSLSLRDEQRNKVLLNTSHCKSISDALSEVFGKKHCTSLRSLRGSHGQMKLSGVISTIAFVGRKIRLVTLNGRIVMNSRIHQTVDSLLKSSLINLPSESERDRCDIGKAMTKPKHYMYAIDITCSKDLYAFTVRSDRKSLQFISWQPALDSIYKILKKFLITFNLNRGLETKLETSINVDQPPGKERKEEPSESKNNPYEKESNKKLLGRKDLSIPSDCEGVQDEATPICECNELKPQTENNHVIYWLRTHVPDEVPMIEDSDIEAAHSSLSLNQSNTSDNGFLKSRNIRVNLQNSSLMTDQTRSSAAKLGSSFNFGNKSTTSIFGSKLKIQRRMSSPHYSDGISRSLSLSNLQCDRGSASCDREVKEVENRQPELTRSAYSGKKCLDVYLRGHHSDSRLYSHAQLSHREMKTPKMDTKPVTHHQSTGHHKRYQLPTNRFDEQPAFKLRKKEAQHFSISFPTDLFDVKESSRHTDLRRDTSKELPAGGSFGQSDAAVASYVSPTAGWAPICPKSVSRRDVVKAFEADYSVKTSGTSLRDITNLPHGCRPAHCRPSRHANNISTYLGRRSGCHGGACGETKFCRMKPSTPIPYGFDTDEDDLIQAEDEDSPLQTTLYSSMSRLHSRVYNRDVHQTGDDFIGVSEESAVLSGSFLTSHSSLTTNTHKPASANRYQSDVSISPTLSNTVPTHKIKDSLENESFGSVDLQYTSDSLCKFDTRCRTSASESMSLKELENSTYEDDGSTRAPVIVSQFPPLDTKKSSQVPDIGTNLTEELSPPTYPEDNRQTGKVEPTSQISASSSHFCLHSGKGDHVTACDSLISSFTSEEMRRICNESEAIDDKRDVPPGACGQKQVTEPDAVPDAAPFQATQNTESTFKTPASKSGMTYKRIKNKYTTPKSLPTLSLLRNQLKSSNFIRFQKELSQPIRMEFEAALTQSLLKTCSVIGQWGNQVILIRATDCKLKELLIAVDQHAAHERVRLEMMEDQYAEITGGKSPPIKLRDPVNVKLDDDLLRFLQTVDRDQMLKKTGVNFDLSENGALVNAVPFSYLTSPAKDYALLKEFLFSVVTEMRDSPVTHRPKAATDILNMQACRGAIKFGDMVTYNECVSLIRRLSGCRLPFQCAHGRPSCIPLTSITAVMEAIDRNSQKLTVHLENLKRLRFGGAMVERPA